MSKSSNETTVKFLSPLCYVTLAAVYRDDPEAKLIGMNEGDILKALGEGGVWASRDEVLVALGELVGCDFLRLVHDSPIRVAITDNALDFLRAKKVIP